MTTHDSIDSLRETLRPLIASQRATAKAAGVPSQSISRWLRGDNGAMSIGSIAAVARECGLELRVIYQLRRDS